MRIGNFSRSVGNATKEKSWNGSNNYVDDLRIQLGYSMVTPFPPWMDYGILFGFIWKLSMRVLILEPKKPLYWSVMRVRWKE